MLELAGPTGALPQGCGIVANSDALDQGRRHALQGPLHQGREQMDDVRARTVCGLSLTSPWYACGGRCHVSSLAHENASARSDAGGRVAALTLAVTNASHDLTQEAPSPCLDSGTQCLQQSSKGLAPFGILLGT